MSNYEYFHLGTPYAMEPEYGNLFSGYKARAGDLGSTTSVRTANQIAEVTSRLNEGVKNVEVSMIQKEVFDQIPKQQIEDIARMAELTGSEISFHAPIIEPSGFTEQGWSEENRLINEMEFMDVVERAKKLSKNGNIPVTVHSSSIPGSSMIKEPGAKEGVTDTIVAVDIESGRLIPVKREMKYFPGSGTQPIKRSAEAELELANESHWDDKLSQIVFYKQRGDELLEPTSKKFELADGEEERGRIIAQDGGKLDNAHINYTNTQKALNGIYHNMMKAADEETKKKIAEAGRDFAIGMDAARVAKENNDVMGQLTIESAALQKFINQMDEASQKKGHVPQVYIPVDEFAREQASKTFSNVAFAAFDKHGEKAPILSIENPPYGGAMSSGTELRKLIETIQKKFVSKAVKNGYSEEEAKRAAKKLIGATWDTVHISAMRSKGFSDKDIIEQAEKIAPYVKHVHMNDGLGGSGGNDLPPGMGDIPLKEMMAKFEKEGFKGKKVFEGGAFAAQFQTPIFPYVLEGVGSPIYPMKMQPAWAGGYFGGGGYYNNFVPFPDQHFGMYGGGFSQLPTELGGGGGGGGRSRFSGTPAA